MAYTQLRILISDSLKWIPFAVHDKSDLGMD